eukprot:CAMPEP_0117494808 /NCGR_PEP_ID=MMETSP0784-20121206/19805_1 /TAXON_ID=39447 /ORGANISM="" /LENGTH=423 /DNA_ID=CAMNT_0005289705 /DNA_START=51 /DNA_END=1318 /DNA_ORIENTATION=+
MGGAVASFVEKAISDVLQVRGDRLKGGLFHATKCHLKPIKLSADLWLTGWIDELKIEASVLNVVTKAVMGKAPPTKIIARGINLFVSGAEDAMTPTRNVQVASDPGRPPPDLAKFAEKLSIDIKDVRVELHVAGHRLGLRIGSIDFLPCSRVSKFLRWDAKPTQARLFVGESKVSDIAEGDIAVGIDLRTQATRISVEVKSVSRVDLDDVALLDILGVVEAMRALVLVAETNGETNRHDDSVDNASFVLTLAEVVAQLQTYGERLLRVSSTQTIVNTRAGITEVECLPLVIACGDSKAVSSDFFARASPEPGQCALQHSFVADAEGQFPHWRGAVEMLVADPRFLAHKEVLMLTCNLPEGDARGRKRARDAADAGEDAGAEFQALEVVTVHRRSFLAQISDVIAELSGGQAIGIGSPQALRRI